MIVGNHPDSREGAIRRLRDHGAHGDPSLGAAMMRYWRGLYALLDEAEIDRQLIFATNVHPAYFARTTGQVPRRGNEPWFAHARRLLEEQLEVMRPRLLLLLGQPARSAFARAVSLRDVPGTLPQPAEIGGVRTTLLVARHPSAPGTTADMRSRRLEAVRRAWHG
jgi:uracil-DNA glycosylase